MTTMFDYDQTIPLAIEQTGVEDQPGVTIRDLSYAGPSGRRVRAYLVRPQRQEPLAGLMFVHPGRGSRTNFLDEAVAMARSGALALVVEAAWAQGQEWPALLAEPAVTQQDFIAIAGDLRRGLDLLLAQPEVDAGRIGYVGHSFGALFGGVLAGVEKRIQAFVLMSGVGSFTDVAIVNMPDLQGEALETRRRFMNPIDPMHYVARAAPAAIFFQFGTHDDYFSAEQFEKYYAAGSQPKSIQWYDADHYQMNAAGRADRMAWLSKQLALAREPEAG